MVLEHERTEWEPFYTAAVYTLREGAEGDGERGVGGRLARREGPGAFGPLLASDGWREALRQLTPAPERDVWVIVQGHQGRDDFSLTVKVRLREMDGGGAHLPRRVTIPAPIPLGR
jgi:hypothetical protein